MKIKRSETRQGSLKVHFYFIFFFKPRTMTKRKGLEVPLPIRFQSLSFGPDLGIKWNDLIENR